MSPLVVPPVFGHGGSLETNVTAASRVGTTITASGTPHTKGSWTSLIDPTSRPSYGIEVRVGDVNASATDTSLLLDIGYGPTGGGNEHVVIPNLGCGQAGTFNGGGATIGKMWFFPVFIPAGVRVSARCQAVIGSDTAIVSVYLHQDALYPMAHGGVLAYGADLANSRGTSVTPAAGSFGTWTQLSSGITRHHRFWCAAIDALGDTDIASQNLLVELGIGPDSSNVSRVYQAQVGQGGVENFSPLWPFLWFGPAVAGTPLWARIAGADTDPRGIIAYGVD